MSRVRVNHCARPRYGGILVLGLIVTPAGIAYADPAAPDAAVEQLKTSVQNPSVQDPGPAAPAIKQRAGSLTAADCGKRAAATKLTAGKKYFACAVDGPAVTKEQLDRMAAIRLAAVDPLRPFGEDFAKGQWAYYRTQACAIFNQALLTGSSWATSSRTRPGCGATTTCPG